MREIKFKGYSKKFVEVWEFSLYEITQLKEKDLRGLDIVQFTGLLDRHGKEIYEGDLFGKMGGDQERPDEYEIHAKVYFDSDLGAFCIDNNRGGWEYLADYLFQPKNEREVIGNIYENPELLERDK